MGSTDTSHPRRIGACSPSPRNSAGNDFGTTASRRALFSDRPSAVHGRRTPHVCASRAPGSFTPVPEGAALRRASRTRADGSGCEHRSRSAHRRHLPGERRRQPAGADIEKVVRTTVRDARGDARHQDPATHSTLNVTARRPGNHGKNPGDLREPAARRYDHSGRSRPSTFTTEPLATAPGVRTRRVREAQPRGAPTGARCAGCKKQLCSRTTATPQPLTC